MHEQATLISKTSVPLLLLLQRDSHSYQWNISVVVCVFVYLFIISLTVTSQVITLCKTALLASEKHVSVEDMRFIRTKKTAFQYSLSLAYRTGGFWSNAVSVFEKRRVKLSVLSGTDDGQPSVPVLSTLSVYSR